MQAARVDGQTETERGVHRRQRMSSDRDHEGFVTATEASADARQQGAAPASAPGFGYVIRAERHLDTDLLP
jgi:hypothetical protein